MPTYRVYFLDEGAHISRPPEVIECVDDQEASQKAQRFIDGLDLEVWRGSFLVARFAKQRERLS